MSLPSQEQIFTNAAELADEAAKALSQARDWLNSDWSDTEPLTDKAVAARRAASALEGLKESIRDIEHQLRDGARSLRDREGSAKLSGAPEDENTAGTSR